MAKQIYMKKTINDKCESLKNKIMSNLADHWIIVNADFTTLGYPTVTSHLQ